MNTDDIAGCLARQFLPDFRRHFIANLASGGQPPGSRRRALAELYARVSEEERAAIADIAYDSFVDGVSESLSILGGSGSLDGCAGRFEIRYLEDGAPPVVIEGLMELFHAWEDELAAKPRSQG
jgi:hypothetical protein